MLNWLSRGAEPYPYLPKKNNFAASCTSPCIAVCLSYFDIRALPHLFKKKNQLLSSLPTRSCILILCLRRMEVSGVCLANGVVGILDYPIAYQWLRPLFPIKISSYPKRFLSSVRCLIISLFTLLESSTMGQPGFESHSLLYDLFFFVMLSCIFQTAWPLYQDRIKHDSSSDTIINQFITCFSYSYTCVNFEDLLLPRSLEAPCNFRVCRVAIPVMTSYYHARTSFARRDLGTDDLEYDRIEINDFIESLFLWENFYELSSFNE